eukprot:gb/GECH01014582.1/.p1 GENE.gb/GECH01014582.1/~~gb/GECH01014582.1/.p1  ORF type:complete len:552 (+),score=112.13 gb/GECH01014582.1/:1-1656(+)
MTEDHTTEFSGLAILNDPRVNKGTAFSFEERDRLNLRGLLPPRAFNMEQQLQRAYHNFRLKSSPLEQYLYLQGLCDRSETLFYGLIIKHLVEMVPILYTPTVGQACQLYGRIYNRPRGLYISINDKGQISKILDNWPENDVRAVVVTDGERILGLGDLGCQGMPIPIGKLQLYTVCAGVDPRKCLPVTIDVGTENEKYAHDPMYIGLQQRRVRGQEYDELIDEFITAVHNKYKHTLIQFEDFSNMNAFRFLQKYRNKVCMFNDDIQGTSAVSVAGIYSALRIKKEKMKDQKFLFLGAGEAGIGIADLLVDALMTDGGLSESEARHRCWFVDSRGLVVKSRMDHLTDHKIPYAHEHQEVGSLADAVKVLKPTALIGVSGIGRMFTRDIIESMAEFNERPIIFALSNPTDHAECTAEEAVQYTNGRVLFASGSPFDPVTFNGHKHIIGQGNNCYIFPGVGLGVLASQAKHITDDVFLAAAKELAELVDEEDLYHGCLYPPFDKVRSVSLKIAEATAEIAFDSGLAGIERPDSIRDLVNENVYEPVYKELFPAQ